MYERVLSQQPKDKIYSLYEPQVYCVAKGKDHKAYEVGTKASFVSAEDEQVILAAVSHAEPVHESAIE